MATVEVSHKAAVFVAPPALPYDIYRSLAKGFPGVHRYSAKDSSTASSFDVNCTFYVG